MTEKQRTAIGSDDAGLEYKQALKSELQHDDRVAELVEVGVGEDDQTPPHVAVAAARLIAGGTVDRALLLCGGGLGVPISANKVPSVRAVTAHDSFSVERSVLSDDAKCCASASGSSGSGWPVDWRGRGWTTGSTKPHVPPPASGPTSLGGPTRPTISATTRTSPAASPGTITVPPQQTEEHV